MASLPSPDWCILRTAGRNTLKLARSLEAEGFDVWTPIEMTTIRVPKANVRRPVKLPIMPSYVFARGTHLIDLLRLSEQRLRDAGQGGRTHADFSVMHYANRIPMIADRQLQGLRRIEAKRTPKKKAERIFGAGVDVRVKIEGGSFAGMHGKVERSNCSHTLVCFDNRLTVKIDTFLLDADDIAMVPLVAVRKAA